MENTDKNQIRRGSLVVDNFGDKGVVVKIVKGTNHENHGTIYVWQSERTGYGADNCEHYPEFEWQKSLNILEW
jgi:hypothetical protein